MATLSELNEKQLLKVLESELCKRSLYEFFKASSVILYPNVAWDLNWHFKYICDLLQMEVERIIAKEAKDKDYVVNLPFRSGKSILISIIFPVWCWVKDPSMSIITVSATDNLATKFSHQSKILIDSEWFQERFGSIFQLRLDTHAKGNYMNSSGGRRESFGINSGIIGSGCDIMLLDDIQSPDNVSAVGLKNTIESYTDVLYSRLNNPEISLRICLQQRVHQNDISGYLMRTNPDKYRHICIPAVLTPDLSPKELAVYYIDKLFWKGRFSHKVLDDFKATMRPAPFAGQLMQRPNVEDGDMIKRTWFSYIKKSEVLKLNLQWYLVLDTAYTNNTKNDPTGMMIVAKYNNSLIVYKAFRKWLQFHELLEEIKELQKVYSIKRIYIEEKASGISIIQELKRATNYNVSILSPNGKDKIERVMSVQPVIESKRVILVEDDWNDTLLDECSSFPLGVHDDLVDCLSYSISQFIQQGGGSVMITR